MGKYNFEEDLAVAVKTEQTVAEILVGYYDAKIIEFGKTNSHDIIAEIDGDSLSFEVKEDFGCVWSGNVALEYKSRGKLSGINTSKADFYIYVIHAKDEIVYVQFPTQTLKNMIANKRYFRTANGGDPGSNTMIYLFKYEVFVKYGTILATA